MAVTLQQQQHTTFPPSIQVYDTADRRCASRPECTHLQAGHGKKSFMATRVPFRRPLLQRARPAFNKWICESFPAPRTTGARPLKIASMVTARDVADGQTAEFDSRASW